MSGGLDIDITSDVLRECKDFLKGILFCRVDDQVCAVFFGQFQAMLHQVQDDQAAAGIEGANRLDHSQSQSSGPGKDDGIGGGNVSLLYAVQ